MSETLAVVLAAGQGTRMKSDLPKVLFPVLGRPMIEYVLDALVAGGVQRIVVVAGYRGHDVRQTLAARANVEFVEQTERLGTGHAVKMALPILERHRGPVMIVAGDSPMLQAGSVRRLLDDWGMSGIVQKLMTKRDISLDDFKQHLVEFLQPGLMTRMLGMIPGMGPLTDSLKVDEAERDVRRMIAIIDAMTPAERRNTSLVDESSRNRIAKECGVEASEVATLCKQFDAMIPMLGAMVFNPTGYNTSPESILAEGGIQKTPPACLLGTLHKENPQGLGRIVRDANHEFAGIVEEKDATDEQRRITEVNMSTYVFDAAELVHALGLLKNENRQKEFYLTDCPGILKSEGKRVVALPILQACEALSINTLDELAAVEAKLREMGYK